MTIFFLPSWNGHLYLSSKEESSVVKVYEVFNKVEKKLISVPKGDLSKGFSFVMSSMSPSKGDVFICGDHSNTYPLFSLCKKIFNNLKLVIFDAHPDVEVDCGVASHEDWLRVLIREKFVKPREVMIIGLRSFSRKELEFLRDNKITVFTPIDVLNNLDLIIKKLRSLDAPVYLSCDIDVLDPDIAPGVYYREMGGLLYEELENLINIIKDKIVFSDICEFLLDNDIDNKTLSIVVNLIELLNRSSS